MYFISNVTDPNKPSPPNAPFWIDFTNLPVAAPPGPTAPSIVATFSPTVITISQTSTLTLTITNTNASTSLAGVAVAPSALPADLSASGLNATYTSGVNGTATYDPGTRQISYSGGTLAAGTSATCTITATISDKTDTSFRYRTEYTTGAVSSSSPATTGTTATADVSVASPPPTVASISPASGPLAGGTTVTISGTDLADSTFVMFGSERADAYTVNSATSITAVAPKGRGTGTVDVLVFTSSGSSVTSAADQFTYADAPIVNSISSTSGPVSGGTSVTITGANLTGATAVKFGATAATSFTVNSATSITAISPAGTGTVDIAVTTAGGRSAVSAADKFTYTTAPSITSISPAGGPVAGGTSVTIAGTNFTGATAVKFGATAATSFTVNSATSITATSPAGTGTVDVTVTTAVSTSPAAAADQFSYAGLPAVASISPASGPTTGGTSVTITGANFAGVSAVKFGATNATSFTVNSATSITAVSPAGAGAVDIVVTAANGTSAVSASDRFTYKAIATSVALASSVNPSSFGRPITFNATVTGSGGTPAGTVTFKDAGAAIGTATLSAGIASFTITTLAVGTHAITASYGGSAIFAASTSPALNQTVNIPSDSVKLHQLQVSVTKIVAQNSGQAISSAIDQAIDEGFADNWIFATPGQTGVRFNFAADPYAENADHGDAPSTSAGTGRGGSILGIGIDNAYGPGTASDSNSGGRTVGNPSKRVNDAFAAIDQEMPRKAPPKKYQEPKDWLFWVDVRGAGLNRLTSAQTAAGLTTSAAPLFGLQVNALAGLTYRMRPNFLVGVIGGYENFNYTEQDVNGKLTGDGWTIGSYMGWKITPSLRYDAAVTYSGIGYNGVAGTAQGNFSGERWMVSTGLTGTYKAWGLIFEPSAKVYALWEHEGAYVDSLGTAQGNHDFSTGRVSGGLKVAYPFAWTDSIELAPYAGIYGDYYFNQDNAAAIVLGGGVPLASTPLLQGWSARATAGLNAKLESGAMVGVGAEFGGIGSDFQTWTVKAKGQLPFSAQ
ncbi:IPT/TIG domain-containing protein [Bradyrhizobium jicamae]|uniref:IPT/TIG domain-containing protein n=1 Tax=Bradyrhizobium jicamae TaxID=280332 RepID=UPI0020112429|nr:IPT/TIG domain-containing protein [Bradyrhizobium jicamae]